MNLKSSRCSKRIYRQPLLCRNKEFKSSVMKFVDSSLNSSALPANNICSTPSEDGCHLIKWRRMDEEYNSLLTNENMKDTAKRSFTASGYNSSLVPNSDGTSLVVPSSLEVSDSGANTVEYTRDYEEHAEPSVRNFLTNSAWSDSNVDNRQPSSTSSMPSYISHMIEDAWEGSSSDADAAKPVTELTSARDICISILKRDIFPTKGSGPSQQLTTIDPDENESSPLFECMRCGLMEDPSKMLICDCCEGAFHLSCCNPRVKKIPEDEWYCMVCKRKKPKRQHEKLTSPKRELPKHIQRPRWILGAIEDMLVDAEPYETEVRIGRDFQAEVPEWSGPISSKEDQFAEPSELDPSEMAMCLQRFKDKKNSFGNWIQCREVLDTGVVCGKWRRAPLFVVQSRDWDCSCSVIWDPIHADCAVPQELETDEVLKQLKYINKLKNRLGDSNQKR